MQARGISKESQHSIIRPTKKKLRPVGVVDERGLLQLNPTYIAELKGAGIKVEKLIEKVWSIDPYISQNE